MDYDSVLKALLAWADRTETVRCVVLTGSGASATAHPLSDRDLELHVRKSETLERDDSWWKTLGDVLAVERLENGDGQPTRLVYYVGGKLDFTLVDIDGERGTYDRPFEVLLDKDGDAAGFRTQAPPYVPVDQAAFTECLNWGYAAAFMIAKAIVRDEPWTVKIRDSDLKNELLRIIEWDHLARYGDTVDVRYLGARMRGWMDVDVQQRLSACWASFDLSDSRKALLASLDLFRDMATRTATVAGLEDFYHEAMRTEVRDILSMAANVERRRSVP